MQLQVYNLFFPSVRIVRYKLAIVKEVRIVREITFLYSILWRKPGSIPQRSFD